MGFCWKHLPDEVELLDANAFCGTAYQEQEHWISVNTVVATHHRRCGRAIQSITLFQFMSNRTPVQWRY